MNKCTANKNNQRFIQRHVWEGSKEKVVQNRKSENGEKIYKMRKQTIERSFADAINIILAEMFKKRDPHR